MSPPSRALRRRPTRPRSPAASSSSSSSAGSVAAATETGEPGRGAGWGSGSDVEAAAVGLRVKRPGRRRGSPVPKRAMPRASGEARSAGGLSLFEAVKAGKSALEPLVDEWLEGYQEDRPGGFVELVNFVVRACGCRGAVTLEMLGCLQNSEIIKGLTEAFEEDSAEYPLLLKTPMWRRFRAGFCEFIAVLVRRAQHNVVYDEYLLDGLIAFLTGLSDSQVRAFRHTSTLAAMKLMTALVHVALSVSLQKDNTQRQYETERAKGLGYWAPGKLEGLLEKHKEVLDFVEVDAGRLLRDMAPAEEILILHRKQTGVASSPSQFYCHSWG